MNRSWEDLAATIGAQLPVAVADRIAAKVTGLTTNEAVALLRTQVPDAGAAPLKHAVPPAAEEPVGNVLAVALRAASRGAAASREQTHVSLAATLPGSSEIEPSADALERVIRSASETLLILTYATQSMPEVTDALRAALDAGVAVRVVAETTTDAAGHFWQDARGAYAGLESHGDITFYRWPHTHRRGSAAMHAKVVVADDHTALITSANLTENALTDNLEVGVVVRHPRLARQFLHTIDDLVTAGTLIRD